MTAQQWIELKANSPTLSPLSVNTELFAKFLFPGTLKKDLYVYNKEEHEEIKKIIASQVGEKAMNIIHKMGMMLASKARSKYIMFTQPLLHMRVFENIMNNISHIPIWFIKESIGYGFTGVVHNFDKKYVIKIFYTKLTDAERHWASSQKKYKFPVFPYIKEWGEDYIILEKLKTKSEDLDYIRNLIVNCTIHKFKEETGYRVLNDKFLFSPSYFKSFIYKIKESMEFIFEDNSIGDLTPSNIGMRISTNELILMDPIDGVISKNFHKTSYTGHNPIFITRYGIF